MTQRATRRAFLAMSGAIGTQTLLSDTTSLPGSLRNAWAERNDDTDEKMPGISVDMPWRRGEEPALSSTTTPLDWCKTFCYSPHVVRTKAGYRMYYIGRTGDSPQMKSLMGFVVGMATSSDGLKWKSHSTPVLTVDNVPWGAFALQTPHVIWDDEEQQYKLWFIGITEWIRNGKGGVAEMTARLGYATSGDGIEWDVHPVPIFESGRRPCVHKEKHGQYRMWMNSRPSRQVPWNTLYGNVYEFRSQDGIQWNRSDEPVLRASNKHRAGCIYPFVCHDADRYFLWYGAYPKRESRGFQIYLAESADGTNWLNYDSQSAFPTSKDRGRFDSYYVSTPCMLIEPTRYLFYYSAVPWSQRQKGSYYQHIGVAVCSREK